MSQDENSFSAINTNLKTLPEDVARAMTREEYERRFDLKLQTVGIQNFSKVRANLRKKSGDGSTRPYNRSTAPAPKMEPNKILHAIPLEKIEPATITALREILPNTLEIALKKMGIAIVPALKVVYTEEEGESFLEVRTK